jgi:outer membrane receptor protein involved in Fe transport
MEARMKKTFFCIVVLCLILLLYSFTIAGTTGKIIGRVLNKESGDPIPGVNIYIEESNMGAASDADGFYIINNIPPGNYTVVFDAIGFQTLKNIKVKVSADFTTKLDIQLSSEVLEAETIVVEAEAPMVRRDLTSSHIAIDSDQIETLPVESINQILALQAGIIQGAGGELHIRGGRSNEIAYTVNGVSITNPFDNSRSVDVATNAIKELSVISGTFNAEYGNALSGIVNTVTKEGGKNYTGSASFYTGDNLSNRDDIFFNIDDIDPLNNNVSEFTISGPIPLIKDYASFFISGRYENNDGYYFGIRQHNTTDSVYKNPLDPNDIRIAATGDTAIVPMNSSEELSSTLKLTVRPFANLKFNYDVIYSNSEYQSYNHDLKYNPDANYNRFSWGLLNAIEMRHALSPKTFYTFRASYNFDDYKRYLYPLLDENGNTVDFHPGMDWTKYHADPRYQPTYKLNRATAYTFLSGGTLNGHFYQRTKTAGAKFDLTSQINNHHELKFGFQYKYHTLDYESFSVKRDSILYFTPTILGTNTSEHDRYTKKPIEFSAYIQDKIEFNSIILNAGLRYDYFNAKSKYSTSTLYPSPNSPTLPRTVDKSSLLADAEEKHQLSPRLGVSFPITSRGIIHFSYGHFFQMPPFSYLYTNPDFKHSFTVGTPVFGNANLNPEKTITYEIGLQQQISENMSFNITGFYKDVRDLLALQQIRISGDETYNKYVNKDYGNIKGIIFSLVKRRSVNNMLGVTVDYTYQVAEGNDTGSDAFFLDISSGRQSEKVPVFLSWDQTHTLNTTVSVGETGNWNASLVGKFGTGLPYTPEVFAQQVFLRPNSSRKPSQLRFDLLAEKYFNIYNYKITLFLKVFNLLDRLNERLVYSDTGSANYSLQQIQGGPQGTDKLAETIEGLRPASEYFQRPNYYLAPRELRLGISIDF